MWVVVAPIFSVWFGGIVLRNILSATPDEVFVPNEALDPPADPEAPADAEEEEPATTGEGENGEEGEDVAATRGQAHRTWIDT